MSTFSAYNHYYPTAPLYPTDSVGGGGGGSGGVVVSRADETTLTEMFIPLYSTKMPDFSPPDPDPLDVEIPVAVDSGMEERKFFNGLSFFQNWRLLLLLALLYFLDRQEFRRLSAKLKRLRKIEATEYAMPGEWIPRIRTVRE